MCGIFRINDILVEFGASCFSKDVFLIHIILKQNIIFEQMKISTSFIARAGVFVVVSELVVPAVVFSNELSSGLSKINGIL